MVGSGLLLAYVYGPDETLADAHALLDPRRDAMTDVMAEVTAYSRRLASTGSRVSPPPAMPTSSWLDRVIAPGSG